MTLVFGSLLCRGACRSAGPVGEAGSGGGVPQTSQVYFAADFSSGIARRNDLSSLRSSAVAVEVSHLAWRCPTANCRTRGHNNCHRAPHVMNCNS